MDMVKLRDAGYCNLKLLLTFLVIYGHLIEPEIWQSQGLMAQYKGIYLFHMPLFCFLSGLFLSGGKACVNQLKKMLPLYFILQWLAVLLGNGEAKPSTPWWHLWYLLSYCIWLGSGWLWFRFGKRGWTVPLLILSVIAGCTAGYFPAIGRVCSLSRTFVFFPYFWIGLLCNPGFPWKRLRLPGIAALILYHMGGRIPVTFLYQAQPYGEVENGFWLRLLCYLLGALLCLFFLAFIPARRFPFSKAGANTLPVYLLHAPVVVFLREKGIPWMLYPVVAVIILYVTYKPLQWFSGL